MQRFNKKNKEKIHYVGNIPNAFKVKCCEDNMFFETKGDGQCFFHAAFGEYHETTGLCQVASPQEMRKEWHHFLSQFHSLSDSEMPPPLIEQLEKVFHTLFDYFQSSDNSILSGCQNTGVKTIFLNQYYATKDKIKAAVDDTNYLVKEIQNSILDNPVVYLNIVLALINHIIQEYHVKGKTSPALAVLKEKYKSYDLNSGDFYDILAKDIFEERALAHDIFASDLLYLQTLIRDDIQKYAGMYDEQAYSEEQFGSRYNAQLIIKGFIDSKEFYQFYLEIILAPTYYVLTEEIVVLATISETIIELFYQDPKGKIVQEVFEPHQELLAHLNNKHQRKQMSLPWDLIEKASIYHEGFDGYGNPRGQHYSKAKRELLLDTFFSNSFSVINKVEVSVKPKLSKPQSSKRKSTENLLLIPKAKKKKRIAIEEKNQDVRDDNLTIKENSLSAKNLPCSLLLLEDGNNLNTSSSLWDGGKRDKGKSTVEVELETDSRENQTYEALIIQTLETIRRLANIRTQIKDKETEFRHRCVIYNLYVIDNSDEEYSSATSDSEDELGFFSSSDDERDIGEIEKHFELCKIKIKKLKNEYQKNLIKLIDLSQDLVSYHGSHSYGILSYTEHQRIDDNFSLANVLMVPPQSEINIDAYHKIIFKFFDLLTTDESFLLHRNNYLGYGVNRFSDCIWSYRAILRALLSEQALLQNFPINKILDKIFIILREKIQTHQMLCTKRTKLEEEMVDFENSDEDWSDFDEDSEEETIEYEYLDFKIKANKQIIFSYLDILLTLSRLISVAITNYLSSPELGRENFFQCIIRCDVSNLISLKVKKIFKYFLKYNLLSSRHLAEGSRKGESVFDIVIKNEQLALMAFLSHHKIIKSFFEKNKQQLICIINLVNREIIKIETKYLHMMEQELNPSFVEDNLDNSEKEIGEVDAEKKQLFKERKRSSKKLEKKYYHNMIEKYFSYNDARFYGALLKMLLNLAPNSSAVRDSTPLLLCHYLANHFKKNSAKFPSIQEFISKFEKVLTRIIHYERKFLLAEYVEDAAILIKSKEDIYLSLKWCQSLKVVYQTKKDSHSYNGQTQQANHEKTVIVPGEVIHFKLKQTVDKVKKEYECLNNAGKANTDINYIAAALTFIYSKKHECNALPILLPPRRGARNSLTLYINLPEPVIVVNYEKSRHTSKFFKHRDDAHACMIIRRAMLAGLCSKDIYQLIISDDNPGTQAEHHGLAKGMAWHSESLLMDYLSQETTLEQIAIRLKDMLKVSYKNQYKIYAVILDVHSNNYSCYGCTPTLFGFQFNEALIQNTTNPDLYDKEMGFLYNLNVVLHRHGFTTSLKNGISMTTRYTAQQPPQREKLDEKKKCDHQNLDEKLPQLSRSLFTKVPCDNKQNKNYISSNSLIIARDVSYVPLQHDKGMETLPSIYPNNIPLTTFGSNGQHIQKRKTL